MDASDVVDVTAQPAIASWTTDTQIPRRLDALRFHVYHDPSANAAFFKLRATATFKSPRSKRSTAAWLYIAPERIQTLALQDGDDVEYDIARQLGPSTVCLHVVLSRQAALVVPPDADLNDPVSGDILEGLQSLAAATSFSIMAILPGRTVNRARWESLCAAASTTAADSDPSKPRLVSSKNAADTASLYGGKGGKVIDGDGLGLVAAAPQLSPPPYAEAGQSPPLLGSPGPSKKRPRTNSDDGCDANPHGLGNGNVLKTALAEEIKSELKADLTGEFRRELLAELKAEVAGSWKAQLKTDLVAEVIREVESRVLRHVDLRLAELEEDFEKQLYDLRHETGATVFSEIEDQTYVARKELEEFVRDEMDEAQKRVEDRIVDRLEGANLNLRFPDP